MRFKARYSPHRGRGYGGWGVYDDLLPSTRNSYVWVRRGASQEVAEGLATWMNAVMVNENPHNVRRVFSSRSNCSGRYPDELPPLPLKPLHVNDIPPEYRGRHAG